MKNNYVKFEFAALDKAILGLYSNIAVSNVERIFEKEDKNNFALLKNLVSNFTGIINSKTFQRKLDSYPEAHIHKYFDSRVINEEKNEKIFELNESFLINLLKYDKNINLAPKSKISNIAKLSSSIEFLRLIRNYLSHKEDYKNNKKDLEEFWNKNEIFKFLKYLLEFYLDFEDHSFNINIFYLFYCTLFITAFEYNNLLNQLKYEIDNEKNSNNEEKAKLSNWHNFFSQNKELITRNRFSFKNPKHNIDYEEKAFAILNLIDQSFENKKVSKKKITNFIVVILDDIFKIKNKENKNINVSVLSIYHQNLPLDYSHLNPWWLYKSEKTKMGKENVISNFKRNYIMFKMKKIKQENSEKIFFMNYKSIVKFIFYLKMDFKNNIVKFYNDLEEYFNFRNAISQSEKIEKLKINFNTKFKILSFKTKQQNNKSEIHSLKKRFESFIGHFKNNYISEKNTNLKKCLKIINHLYFLEFEKYLNEDKHLELKNAIFQNNFIYLKEEFNNWKKNANENSFIDVLIKELNNNKQNENDVWRKLNNFNISYFSDENIFDKYVKKLANKREELKSKNKNKPNGIFEFFNDSLMNEEKIIYVKDFDSERKINYKKRNISDKHWVEQCELFDFKKYSKIMRKILPLLFVFNVYRKYFETKESSLLKSIDWCEQIDWFSKITTFKIFEDIAIKYVGKKIYIRKKILSDLDYKKMDETNLKQIKSNSHIYESKIYENFSTLTVEEKKNLTNDFKIINTYIKKRELYFVRKYLYLGNKDTKDYYFRNRIMHRLSDGTINSANDNQKWRKEFIKNHLEINKTNNKKKKSWYD